MVIYVKPGGETVVSNDSIGLGSRVGRVDIVAPQRPGAFVELLINLPSGLIVPPHVCAPMPELDAQSVGVYYCNLQKSVTAEAGRVRYQVRFTYTDGQIELMPGGSFAVQEGVLVVPPDEIEEDSYDEIKEILAVINANYAEVLEKFDEFREVNDQTLASLQNALTRSEAAAEQADKASARASKSATDSASGATSSGASAAAADVSKTAAEESAIRSEAAAERADQASARANKSASAAETSQTAALASQTAAAKSAEDVKALISQVPKFVPRVVSVLPSSGISATTLYLVKVKNVGVDKFSEHLFIPYDRDTLLNEYESYQGEWETISSGASIQMVGAPSFDLSAIGLPATPINGSIVRVSYDTSAITKEADNGPIKLSLLIGSTASLFVSNGIKYGNRHIFFQQIDSTSTLMVTMTSNEIASNVIRIMTLPDTSEYEDGSVLTIVDGSWIPQKPKNESVGVTSIDLISLGLPTVMTDGTTSDLTLDTTAIRAALDKGAVKFALNVDGSGAVEVVMNKYEVNGLYICTYTVFNLTLTLMIATNGIQASATAVSSAATYNGEVEVV